MEQFSLPLESDASKEAPLTKEIILQWSEEQRNAKYKELTRQHPFADMTPEQVANGILNPEEEIEMLRRRNMEDDKTETTRTYRV